MHRADIQTHMDERWLGSGESRRIGMKELKEPKPAPGRNGIASGSE
jgi:hypothetical protein